MGVEEKEINTFHFFEIHTYIPTFHEVTYLTASVSSKIEMLHN